MTGRVCRDGAWAIKSYGQGFADATRRTAVRSQILSGAGVPTPMGRYQAAANTIWYPWIEGTSGRCCFRLSRRRKAQLDFEPIVSYLDLALRALFHLHRADPGLLALSVFDPWRRIQPRFVAGDADSYLRSLCDKLRRRLADHTPPSRPNCLVHGDFHVGQVLFQPGKSVPWLLDIDDIALGRPESDLGNFVGHLTTSDVIPPGDLRADFDALVELICTLYQRISKDQINLDLLRTSGTITLVRRGLKLREQGRLPETLDGIFLVAESLATG